MLKSPALYALTCIMILSVNAKAQFTIDNALTPEEVVTLLLGGDVEASNITLSGDANQIGSFLCAGCNLNMEGGIILASGDVMVTQGPNNTSGNTLGGGNSGATDPDLDELDPDYNHNDAVVLEFDFVSTGDELSFNYVFGSEEYPEFVGSFNDIFGFFLSGPGISGPFENNGINIALVPGTSDYVSINNINNGGDGINGPCTNCEYYIYNGDGFTAPYNTDPIYIQFDGFTTVLQAVTPLICGETYHIKLVVADALDTILDTAVFLEAGSFAVSNSIVTAYVANPAPGQTNTDLLEDCGIEGQFIIVPPACLTEADTIDVSYSGTATYGDDFTTNISGQLIINPDEPDTIFVFPVDDDIIDGTETITINFYYTNNQGLPDTAFATLNIIDYVNMTLAPIDPLFICPGSDAEATAIPIEGYAPFEYSWTSGGSQQSETYVAGQAGSYTVTVTDYCGSEAYIDFVVNEPPAFEPIDSVDACVGMSLSFLQFGGALPYTYEYDTLQFFYIDGDDAFQSLVAGHYFIEVTDQCGQVADVDIFADVCDTWVPNIFTPNSDGDNDYFEIFGVEAFPNSTITVFNRWGNVVYENTNYKNTWQGDDLPEGTYYWVFERSDKLKQAGYVQIVREQK